MAVSIFIAGSAIFEIGSSGDGPSSGSSGGGLPNPWSTPGEQTVLLPTGHCVRSRRQRPSLRGRGLGHGTRIAPLPAIPGGTVLYRRGHGLRPWLQRPELTCMPSLLPHSRTAPIGSSWPDSCCQKPPMNRCQFSAGQPLFYPADHGNRGAENPIGQPDTRFAGGICFD